MHVKMKKDVDNKMLRLIYIEPYEWNAPIIYCEDNTRSMLEFISSLSISVDLHVKNHGKGFQE